MANEDSALVPNQDGREVDEQEPKVNAEESGTAKSADADGEEPDPQAPENDGEPKHKRLGGWQRRIQRQEREIEFWRNQALTQPKAESKAAATVEEKPKPEPKDFDLGDGTYDLSKYTDALTDWKLEKRDKAIEAKLAERDKAKEQQSAKQTVEQKWAGKMAAAREQFADWDEVVEDAREADLPVTEPMHDYLLDSESGAELFYYLGKHHDEALAIAQMSPLRAAGALGRIEAKLASKKSQAADEGDDDTPAKPASRAPAPIQPVKKPGGTSRPFDPNDEATARSMSADEWAKKRYAHLNRK